MTDRFTIANMAIEAGGKNGIFPVDEKTIAYIEGRYHKPFDVVEADEDAHYSRVVEIDLSSMKPVVSLRSRKIRRSSGTLGRSRSIRWSSVPAPNGRLEDLAIAARIFKGHKVHPNVRCIVILRHRQFTCRPCMRLHRDLHRCRMCRVYTDLRPVPWRLHGDPCKRREMRIHHE